MSGVDPESRSPAHQAGDRTVETVPFDWLGLARFGLGYAGTTVLVIVGVFLLLPIGYQFPTFVLTVVAAIGALAVLTGYREPAIDADDESDRTDLADTDADAAAGLDPTRRRLLRRLFVYCVGVFAFAWVALIALPSVLG